MSPMVRCISEMAQQDNSVSIRIYCFVQHWRNVNVLYALFHLFSDFTVFLKKLC